MSEPTLRPYIIGLTGNIAAGKSTIAHMLVELGAEHIDADRLTHELMQAGSGVWEQVVATFGREVLTTDGQIDRRRLGQIVFANPKALAQLEAIIHPQVIRDIRRRIECSSSPVVVVEAIKLIESGIARQMCHTLWVVTAARATRIRRLIEQRGLSENEAASRVDMQSAQETKIAQADLVIDNDLDQDAARSQIRQAWIQAGLPLDPPISL